MWLNSIRCAYNDTWCNSNYHSISTRNLDRDKYPIHIELIGPFPRIFEFEKALWQFFFKTKSHKTWALLMVSYVTLLPITHRKPVGIGIKENKFLKEIVARYWDFYPMIWKIITSSFIELSPHQLLNVSFLYHQHASTQ